MPKIARTCLLPRTWRRRPSQIRTRYQSLVLLRRGPSFPRKSRRSPTPTCSCSLCLSLSPARRQVEVAAARLVEVTEVNFSSRAACRVGNDSFVRHQTQASSRSLRRRRIHKDSDHRYVELLVRLKAKVARVKEGATFSAGKFFHCFAGDHILARTDPNQCQVAFPSQV